jgi:transcriptional regulator with XRE-family HTH domain
MSANLSRGPPPARRSARPDPAIDEHLGRRLRQRRRQLGLTQDAVARSGGMQFQLIQKYECGAAAMSAGRLWQLATLLSVPISYFFQGLGPSGTTFSAPAAHSVETAALMRTFAALPDESRRRLSDLVKEMAGSLTLRSANPLGSDQRPDPTRSDP